MTTTHPLACNMNVFTPAERERHLRVIHELFGTVQAVQEVDNGYGFDFPDNPGTITSLAGFIADERRCCPFLEFTLRIPPEPGAITLLLAGPEGTREFLREEFSQAFA